MMGNMSNMMNTSTKITAATDKTGKVTCEGVLTITRKGLIRLIAVTALAFSLIGGIAVHVFTPEHMTCTALEESTGVHDGGRKISEGGKINTTCGKVTVDMKVNEGNTLAVTKYVIGGKIAR